MGVYNCQLYNNLGLCCFYAQQYDMTLSSFKRALQLAANDEEVADVWYNMGHVAVVYSVLAYQCFKLAKAFLQTASALAPHMYEPHYNFSTLSERMGDLQSSYTAAQKSAALFPEHVNTQQLINQLKQHFAVL
ncbi:TTC8 protein, partial [Polyodon spathula]|nr:TTC8 protein [Polyodon spathula]